MSLVTWLKKAGDKPQENAIIIDDVNLLLPNPNSEVNDEKRAEILAANKVVARAVVQDVQSRKKR